jgi:hypothetical protein
VDDDRLAEGVHFHDLAAPVPEHAPEGLEGLLQPLMASVGSTLGFEEHRREHDIGVDQLGEGIPIPSVESVI